MDFFAQFEIAEILGWLLILFGVAFSSGIRF